MGRGRGKGNLAHRRRGRPQKPLKTGAKDDDREISEKIEEISVVEKEIVSETETNNGRKRGRSMEEAKEKIDSLEEDNGDNAKTNIEKSIVSVGFRQIGSRRKNKPRRAAEVGVECN